MIAMESVHVNLVIVAFEQPNHSFQRMVRLGTVH